MLLSLPLNSMARTPCHATAVIIIILIQHHCNDERDGRIQKRNMSHKWVNDFHSVFSSSVHSVFPLCNGVISFSLFLVISIYSFYSIIFVKGYYSAAVVRSILSNLGKSHLSIHLILSYLQSLRLWVLLSINHTVRNRSLKVFLKNMWESLY